MVCCCYLTYMPVIVPHNHSCESQLRIHQLRIHQTSRDSPASSLKCELTVPTIGSLTHNVQSIHILTDFVENPTPDCSNNTLVHFSIGHSLTDNSVNNLLVRSLLLGTVASSSLTAWLPDPGANSTSGVHSVSVCFVVFWCVPSVNHCDSHSDLNLYALITPCKRSDDLTLLGRQ